MDETRYLWNQLQDAISLGYKDMEAHYRVRYENSKLTDSCGDIPKCKNETVHSNTIGMIETYLN